MTITMMVEESGSVARVQVTDSALGAGVDGCVRGVVEHFRFNPGPEGGANTYELALRFSPAGGGEE